MINILVSNIIQSIVMFNLTGRGREINSWTNWNAQLTYVLLRLPVRTGGQETGYFKELDTASNIQSY